MEFAEEEQAVLIVLMIPSKEKRSRKNIATEAPSYEYKYSESRDNKFASRYNSSVKHIPPTVVALIKAVPGTGANEPTASDNASEANCIVRVTPEPPKTNGYRTSPTGNTPAYRLENPDNGPIPERPETSASRLTSTPAPSAVQIPIPVMTISLKRASF